MATTTNYGWTTPDDTSLVKDGASAIRTLGSSIDTTTKNLNPQTTTGAIAYRSATSNVNTSLPIGTAGQALTVNSGATAPEWATPSSGGMTLISTTSLTGASVTLSSIPSTYVDLRLLVINFKPATDGGVFMIRANADSGANRYRTEFAAVGGATFNTTAYYLQYGNDNTTATGLIDITIPSYANTTTMKVIYGDLFNNDESVSTSVSMGHFFGAYNQTGAISSLVLLPHSGNFTSGEVLLYGVK